MGIQTNIVAKHGNPTISYETGLMSVNIKVECPDVSECTCSRSHTSFKWPAVEPDWGAV